MTRRELLGLLIGAAATPAPEKTVAEILNKDHFIGTGYWPHRFKQSPYWHGRSPVVELNVFEIQRKYNAILNTQIDAVEHSLSEM